MSKRFGYVPAYTEDKVIELIDKLRRTYKWKKKHKKHLID